MLASVRSSLLASSRRDWVARCLSTVASTAPPVAAAPSLPSIASLIAGTPSTADAGRIRYKSHFKRASEVMNVVRTDAQARMEAKMSKIRPRIPHFRVGDAVEVLYATETNEKDPMPVRGTVLGKWNRGLDSKFTIINSWDNEWYTATYVYSSPLLRGIKVLQKNRWSEGARVARRAKLTNLKEADPRMYYVDANTKEASVLQAEKEARKALARAGKLGKKKKDNDRAAAKGGAAAAGAGGSKGSDKAADAKGGAKAAKK